MNTELNAIQVVAIRSLTDGKLRAEVSQELGITEQELASWQDIPAFVAE